MTGVDRPATAGLYWRDAEMKRLKRCPFCGSKAEFRHAIPSGAWAYCVGCGASSCVLADEADAAEAWNQRVAASGTEKGEEK